MIEFVIIVYLGVNIASGLFFYMVEYDVEYILGGDRDKNVRALTFVTMMLFGTLILLYLFFDNLTCIISMFGDDYDDFSQCSDVRTTNNFGGIRFSGEGE